MQHGLFFFVAESHVFKLNFTFERNIRNAAVMMRMFPCPLTSRQKSFCNSAVSKNVGVDQHYIAVINFRFFINYGKDTLCTGKRIQNTVEHLRHLRNRVLKAARILKERRNASQVHLAADNQHYTGNCSQRIAYVPHVVHKRSKNVCKRVRLCTGGTKLVVKRVKFSLRSFFAAKNLNDFLPFDKFFDIAVDFAYRFLLRPKSFC